MRNKTLDMIHIKVHALRMLPDYSPTVFEQELNKIIAEEYKEECKECADKFDRLKYITPTQKKGFLSGVFK